MLVLVYMCMCKCVCARGCEQACAWNVCMCACAYVGVLMSDCSGRLGATDLKWELMN
jgi:hypothetical protein